LEFGVLSLELWIKNSEMRLKIIHSLIKQTSVLLFGLILWLILVAGCYDPPPPANIFIPEPDINTTVTISVSTNNAAVDEPVILYASGMSSGLVEIPYADVQPGVQWWRPT
jgi:hypothetical protein